MFLELLSHMRVHSGSAYKCSICNAPFRTQKGIYELAHLLALTLHEKSHPETSAKFFSCPTCMQLFSTEVSLRAHLTKSKKSGCAVQKPAE
jgi:hypothetical protein